MFEIELAEYQKFEQEFFRNPGFLRFGQAFFNHFDLHKMNNVPALDRLYQMDGEKAKAEINRLFVIR